MTQLAMKAMEVLRGSCQVVLHINACVATYMRKHHGHCIFGSSGRHDEVDKPWRSAVFCGKALSCNLEIVGLLTRSIHNYQEGQTIMLCSARRRLHKPHKHLIHEKLIAPLPTPASPMYAQVIHCSESIFMTHFFCVCYANYNLQNARDQLRNPKMDV